MKYKQKDFYDEMVVVAATVFGEVTETHKAIFEIAARYAYYQYRKGFEEGKESK